MKTGSYPLRFGLLFLFFILCEVVNSSISNQSSSNNNLSVEDERTTPSSRPFRKRKGKNRSETPNKAQFNNFLLTKHQEGAWKGVDWWKDKNCFRKHEIGKDSVLCSALPTSFKCLDGSLESPSSTLKNSPVTVASLVEINGTINLDRFSRYKALDGLPKCWKSLKELICGVQIAPCRLETQEDTNPHLLLKKATFHLCQKAKKDCHFIVKNGLWPPELGDCSDESIYTNNCKAQQQDQVQWIWNATSQCLWPLVKSDTSPWILEDQCALNCTSPFFSDGDHFSLRVWLPIVLFPMLFFCIFTLLCKLIGWEENHSSLNPLYVCVLCYAFICLCWLLSVFGRDSIICQADGSVRLREPHNYSGITACTAQFFVLYLAVLACGCWLVMFSYAQKLTLRRMESLIKKNFSRFHFSWGPPILFTVFALVFWKVESDGISGVCFVGYWDPLMASVFLYIPLGICILLAWTLFLIGVWLRRREPSVGDRLRGNGQERLDDHSKLSPLSPMKTTLLFSLITLSYGVSLLFHILDFSASSSRAQSIKDYLLCQLDWNYKEKPGQEGSHCELSSRLNPRLLHVHIILIQFLPCATLNIILWTTKGGWSKIWATIRKGSTKHPQMVNNEMMDFGGFETSAEEATDEESKNRKSRKRAIEKLKKINYGRSSSAGTPSSFTSTSLDKYMIGGSHTSLPNNPSDQASSAALKELMNQYFYEGVRQGLMVNQTMMMSMMSSYSHPTFHQSPMTSSGMTETSGPKEETRSPCTSATNNTTHPPPTPAFPWPFPFGFYWPHQQPPSQATSAAAPAPEVKKEEVQVEKSPASMSSASSEESLHSSSLEPSDPEGEEEDVDCLSEKEQEEKRLMGEPSSGFHVSNGDL